MYTEATS